MSFTSVLKKYARRYFIDAMSAMALGLFASLLIGTIFSAIGLIPGLALFKEIGDAAKLVAGPAMAVAIAYALHADPLVVFTSAFVGYLANDYGKAGGPLAVFIIAIVASEIGMLVSKKTKVDILVTPFVTLLVGGLLSLYFAPLIGKLASLIASLISFAMTRQTVLMGILVSVVVGMVLTLPLSSAAICASLGLSGMASGDVGLALAGGAAVAGCCAQMIGFAVISFKDNRWSGLVSQGLGTSMLQMSNIFKNPWIWLPPTLASAVTGPLASAVFGLKMFGSAINSGMGTCGMLGPVGVILGWFGGEYPDTVTAFDWIGLFLICFILPALLSYLFYFILKKLGRIKDGDMSLNSGNA